MSVFPKVDMREVTRLTKAGKLAEAVRLLQGGNTNAPTSDPPETPPTGWTRLIAATPQAQSPAAPPDAEPVNIASRAKRLLAARSLVGFALKKDRVTPDLSKLTPGGGRFENRSFSNSAGTRTYKVFIPGGAVGQPLPVVVMLHGCTQDPDDFAAGTRMNEVAQEQKFLVVYPAQPQSANLQKCWNWFNASEQQRDGGEPSLIAGITREVIAKDTGDPARVYVAGLSAGGAAAANLAANYPDLFAAAGVHSGLACGAARDMGSAFVAMSSGGAVPPRQGPPTPTIVFHGDADRTVNPVNGENVIAQNLPQGKLIVQTTQGQTPAGLAFTRKDFADASGAVVLEQWSLHGAGHAWSGGSPEGSYTEPRGPDASREMARFFLKHRQRS